MSYIAHKLLKFKAVHAMRVSTELPTPVLRGNKTDSSERVYILFRGMPCGLHKGF